MVVTTLFIHIRGSVLNNEKVFRHQHPRRAECASRCKRDAVQVWRKAGGCQAAGNVQHNESAAANKQTQKPRHASPSVFCTTVT